MKKFWALLVFCASLASPNQEATGEGAKRALLIVNARYSSKLPDLPIDDTGVKVLADVLQAAGFEVTLRQNLNFESLYDTLQQYQASFKNGDVSLVYYAGYIAKYRGIDYLIPVGFDPAKITKPTQADDFAYRLASLEQSLSESDPAVSMFLLEANWTAPEFGENSGPGQQTVMPHTWIFSASAPGEATIRTVGKMGLFTNAIVSVLPQHGLDLADIATKVKAEVKSASDGAQYPSVWNSDLRFYFFPPDPVGARMNGNDHLNYVFIPSGSFWMGCVPASESQCRHDEKPRHRVEITQGFWLGETEVTNQAYQRFANANKKRWKPKKHVTDAGKQGDLPVVDATFHDAEQYCQWVAKGGRLPTEAEWEYSARGGKDDEVYPYSDIGNSREVANYKGQGGSDRFDDLAPVKSFDFNGFKLFDMAGNVWERVRDPYSATYYSTAPTDSPLKNPQGPAKPDKGKQHVVRGGSWDSDPKEHLRISYRKSDGTIDGTSNNVGFRCVIPNTPEARASFKN